ncbi:prolipoprotein diacylglyceryl transferase [Ferruginibacter lapsinanis]|uniref:prolipoprotein diacylglyceryl transferase n=1 Tax=Ferruginibacter lapsinanis TaxID=563172 RepID=UPI001E4B8143|nr:prolipoprotein diacylglyceryl transferase family protein [Ferruginibacter lapsinanis]UEG49788.1 prolipoprotein diacylglyceryl transferase [Ferruginibacter lapsinanis]
MYPNLYYVFKDWFGVEWKALSFLNTFGLMVALGFVVSAIVLSAELKRKEKQGLLHPREEAIMVGQPVSFIELLTNFLTGFIFAYKLVGLFFNKPEDMNPQDYIFSTDGNILGGLILGLLLAGLKWWDKHKQKLKEPERRTLRIWPHDRVGDIIIIGLVFGLLGAKLFDNFENWDEFIAHPIERLFSASGLTFYGGLILATIAIACYAVKKGIKPIHLADSVAPALMIAYAVGRIGCQVAGDGDWGIYNSAYVTDASAKVALAKPNEFNENLKKYSTYFLIDTVINADGSTELITDRKSPTLDKVPHATFKGPSFLPKWMFAYNYPNNVNKDGIKIPGSLDEYNRVLPTPVFPTPFYETVLCTILFLFLWSIRKKIKAAGVISSIYLILNGLERFAIEKIRVNYHYNVFGFSLSQAEIIALLIVLSGVLLYVFLPKKAVSGI